MLAKAFGKRIVVSPLDAKALIPLVLEGAVRGSEVSPWSVLLLMELPVTPTEDEFYELIWSEPASKLGPRLGITGVGLAKACRRADVPVPERGYWARLQAGRTVLKRPLPPRGLGMSDTVTIGENPYEAYEVMAARLLAEPISPPPTFAEELPQVVERVRRMVGPVRIPKSFDRAHPIVARLLDEDDRRREKQAKATFSFASDAPLFESAIERRRLRIINGLFLGLQRYGGQPWIRDRQARETGVQVGHQNVGVSIEWAQESRRSSRPVTLGQPQTRAHGRMRLSIKPWDSKSGGGKSWEDADGKPFESLLREVVTELLVTGEAHYRAGAVAHHQWVIERRAELIEEARRRKVEEERRERERLAKLEKERLDRLFAAAEAWRRAADLRAFVDAVRVATGDLKIPIDTVERWASDALTAADRLDPLRSGQFHVHDPNEKER